MNLVEHLTRRWNRFFFAPDSAENLAVCRILFYGGLLALNWNQDFTAWGRVADVFWMPGRFWPFEYFNIPLLPPPILGLMSVVWKVSLTLSCLGLLTRLFSVMSFVLGFYLLGLPNCFGDLAHGDAATVLILGVMAIAPSEDALSLDRAIWNERALASGEYRWPVRMVWLILSTVFFAAGYAKLSQGGLRWALSDNMSFILAEHQFPPEHPEALVPWGKWMARQSWLARGMGLATLILEAGYPLAMFSRRARFVFVPGMLLSVIGFRVLLGPSFFPLILCHVFWVRWRPQDGAVGHAIAHKPHLAAIE